MVRTSAVRFHCLYDLACVRSVLRQGERHDLHAQGLKRRDQEPGDRMEAMVLSRQRFSPRAP